MSWEKVKLGNISVCIQPGPFGSQLHNSDYSDEGTPIIMPKDMVEGHIRHSGLIKVPEEHVIRLQRHRVYEGNIMVARKGDVRKCVYITKSENGWLTGSDCLKVVLNEKCCFPKFIYYQLRSPYIGKWLEQISIGATMPSINTGLLSGIEIFLPPLEAQRRIADILSAYDDLIENNQKQIKLLEEAAQRLYKEWFVDLHFPGYEHTNIVDGVPEGWEKKFFEDIAEIKYGKDHKSIPDGSVPVYGSGGLMRKCAQILYKGESVLIPRKGSLNNIMYVDEAMFYTKMKCPNIGIYLYYYLKSFDMYSMNIGAAVPSMTTKVLNSLNIVIPSDKILSKFYYITKKHFQEIKILQEQGAAAAQSRDQLLPKLMSGEIKI